MILSPAELTDRLIRLEAKVFALSAITDSLIAASLDPALLSETWKQRLARVISIVEMNAARYSLPIEEVEAIRKALTQADSTVSLYLSQTPR